MFVHKGLYKVNFLLSNFFFSSILPPLPIPFLFFVVETKKVRQENKKHDEEGTSFSSISCLLLCVTIGLPNHEFI